METMNQGKVKYPAEKFHLSIRAFLKEVIKQGEHGFQGVLLWHVHGAVAKDAEAQRPAHRVILAGKAIFVIVCCDMAIVKT